MQRNYPGKDILPKMGLSWFVSYSYYLYIDNTHKHWTRETSVNSRISTYNRSKPHHTLFLQVIVEKSTAKLGSKAMELTGSQVVAMAKELLVCFASETHNQGNSVMPKVYLCCHPNDRAIYTSELESAVFDACNCTFYYRNEETQKAPKLEKELLCSMHAFLVPVTEQLLYSENFPLSQEIPLAKEHNIPIIPIAQNRALGEKFLDLVGNMDFFIHWDPTDDKKAFSAQLSYALPPIFTVQKKGGSWIFLSHSSADIAKVRIIRNRFEKNKQNPLAFHLKCLQTDTAAQRKELINLIKREIEARDWFVFCDSMAAKSSSYVKMERDHVAATNKKKIWTIDLALSNADLEKRVDEICTKVNIFLSYPHKHDNAARNLSHILEKVWDFNVLTHEKLRAMETYADSTDKKIRAATAYGIFVALLWEGEAFSPFTEEEIRTALHYGASVVLVTFGRYDTSLFPESENVIVLKLPRKYTNRDLAHVAQMIEDETRKQIQGS